MEGWLGWVGLMGGGKGMELVEEVVDEGDLDYFLGLFSQSLILNGFKNIVGKIIEIWQVKLLWSTVQRLI